VLNEFIERDGSLDRDLLYGGRTNGTVMFLRVFKCVGMKATGAHVHHVTIQILRAKRQELHGFVHAGCGDDGVGTCHCRDDVLT
jgi:hypothetical protein